MNMRDIIQLCEASEAPRVLYHGSKRRLRRAILTQGLTPQTDDSWNEFGPGVYLALTAEMAAGYGELVFAVDLSQLDEDQLLPDDYELRDYFEGEWGDESEGEYGEEEFRPEGIFEASWLDSLRICGQCKYMDVIPPSALTVMQRTRGGWKAAQQPPIQQQPITKPKRGSRRPWSGGMP